MKVAQNAMFEVIDHVIGLIHDWKCTDKLLLHPIVLCYWCFLELL